MTHRHTTARHLQGNTPSRDALSIAERRVTDGLKVVDTLLGGSFWKIELLRIENLCPSACAMLYRGIE